MKKGLPELATASRIVKRIKIGDNISRARRLSVKSKMGLIVDL